MRVKEGKRTKKGTAFRKKETMVNDFVEDCLNCPYPDCSSVCYKKMLKGKGRKDDGR